jgi:hypothetical protein
MKYKIGDMVYLKTDSDQKERMITGILVRQNNNYRYYLTCGTEETSHYDFEMSYKADVLKRLDIQNN